MFPVVPNPRWDSSRQVPPRLSLPLGQYSLGGKREGLAGESEDAIKAYKAIVR